MERVCLDCQTPLKGRADKKFCDDQCRSSFNNSARIRDLNNLKMVNKTLKKNRDILKASNPQGKTKIKKETLMKKGFNFIYHTHTYCNKSGMTYFFCYEYGYLHLTDEDAVLLVRWEEKK